MERGLGRVAGLVAFGLMVARMTRLLDTSEQAPQWPLIMISAALLGGVMWWVLRRSVPSRTARVVIFALVALGVFLRISVPDSLVGGFFPSAATGDALTREILQAVDLIRYGVAPVFPTPGLVAVLGVLMMVVGALYSWGASSGPAAAMIIPSLALYLQFAVMDRVVGGRSWMIAFMIATALGIAGIAADRRGDAGRARDPDGRPLPRTAYNVSVVVALVVAIGAVLATTASAGLVPSSGNLRWRLGGGYGPGFGGVAFDRLADLQQRVITRSNVVVFRATFSEDAPPPEDLYFRMESLDVFDGERWRPSVQEAAFYEPGNAGGLEDQAYRGTVNRFTERIAIDQLRTPVVPTSGIAQVLQSDNLNVSSFQVTSDGSILYQPLLSEGDQYQAEVVYPNTAADIAAMATLPDGTLSPLFANAAEAGDFPEGPEVGGGDTTRPPGLDRFLELPEDTPVTLEAIAIRETSGATTDFEKAWVLQHWFRESGDFDYSTDVSTGHNTLQLVDWLTDPESLNYRTGYCEQFAAAMAVLGRALDIPSRVVWGFTPGKVQTQDDGTQVVVVRDNNAHAWVEMWIDGFGWVSFDPTPRGDGTQTPSITAAFDPVPYLPPPDRPAPDINRPGFVDETNRDDPTGLGAGGGRVLGIEIQAWWWVIPVALLAVAMIPIAKAVRRRRRVARIKEGDITAAWEEIVDRLTDLGDPIPEHETPLEFARSADRTLIPLANTYSAAIYGGVNGRATLSDLATVERWIDHRYETGERMLASFNFRSLLPRRDQER